MKKIFISWNGMASEQVSGGDVYIISLLKNIKKFSFEVMGSMNSKEYIKLNYSTIFKTKKDNLFLIYLFRTIQSFLKSLKIKREYLFSISSTPFIYDLIPALMIKSKNKIAIIYHLPGKRESSNLLINLRYFLSSVEKKLSYFLIKRYFDTIITGSVSESKKIIQIFPGKNLIISHAGFDSDEIDSVKNVKRDKNKACFVGRIVSQKGIFDLIEIMKKLQKDLPELRLEIIGTGPEYNLLNEKIIKNKLKNIKLLGFLSNQEKYFKMKSSGLFLFPSYEEGWGISLAEALYSNCKCICYDLPHYREIFKNYPEYIPLGDIDEFIKRIKEILLKNPKKAQISFIRRYNRIRSIKKLEEELWKISNQKEIKE